MSTEANVIPKEQHEKEMEKLRNRLKPNNLLKVNFNTSLEFFKWYCIFIKPFIGLTDREQDVVASFLNQRYELSKEIKNEATIDSLLMTEDIKKKILEESHVTLQHFYVVMSTLRKKGIFEGNKLIPEVIPNVKEENNGIFKLMILFTDETKSNGI